MHRRKSIVNPKYPSRLLLGLSLLSGQLLLSSCIPLGDPEPNKVAPPITDTTETQEPDLNPVVEEPSIPELEPDSPKIEALFNATDHKQPKLNYSKDGIAFTYIGTRVRERHARESQFRRYRSFPRFYFEKRTFSLELIDKTANGEPELVVHLISDHPFEGDAQVTGRYFFSGINTVADYFIGSLFETVTNEYSDGRYHYRHTLRDQRLVAGNFMEMEITVFLTRIDGVGQERGDANYYSRTWLLELGKPGVLPWQASQKLATSEAMATLSEPLPADALSGGQTTLSEDLSDEPFRSLQQMAMNLSPLNAQHFVEGRRLHHTNFQDGSHSEPGNPIFDKMAGKLGPDFINHSCVGCHGNNGRNEAIKPGEPIKQMVFKIAATDGDGKPGPHPLYGTSLQTQSLTGNPEAAISVAGYDTFKGQYDDGEAYELVSARFHIESEAELTLLSARSSPALLGLGLLEAISEERVMAWADAEDQDQDGISGRASIIRDPVDGHLRLGRFGWKADQISLRHQTASALFHDMGVSNPLIPGGNGEKELDDNDFMRLVTYLSTTGVPPRRKLEDPEVQAGERLFRQAQCAKCHLETVTTGDQHPFAELRLQTIKPYTDLLLHDMGESLASDWDSQAATRREWRTAPLWGIGLAEEVAGGKVGYLHDGRARTLAEAILWHGGEALPAQQAFKAMTKSQRQQLLAFLRSL